MAVHRSETRMNTKSVDQKSIIPFRIAFDRMSIVHTYCRSIGDSNTPYDLFARPLVAFALGQLIETAFRQFGKKTRHLFRSSFLRRMAHVIKSMHEMREKQINYRMRS